MKQRTLVFAVIALFPLLSCGNRKVSAQLDDIESYIQERPDSALAAIEAIDTNSLNTRALAAKYSLLHAMALDKNYIDTTDLSIIESAVSYYMMHGSADRKMKSLYYRGRIHYNAKDYINAVLDYTKATEYLDDSDDYYKALLYSAFSSAENRTYDYEEAIRYSEMARKIFTQMGLDNYANNITSNIARNYANLGQYGKADSLFSALLSSPDARSDIYAFAETESSYAYMLTSATNPDYEKARKCFEDALGLVGRLNTASQWGAYAKTLAATGDTKSAYGILEQLKDGYEYEYTYWLSQVQSVSGNMSEAFKNLEEALSYSNKLIFNAFARSSSKVRSSYYEDQSSLLKIKTERLRLWILVMALSSIIIILSLFLIIRHRIRKSEEEKNHLLEIAETARMQVNSLTIRHERERASVQEEFFNLYKNQFQYFNSIGEAVLEAKKKKNKDSSGIVYRKAKQMVEEIYKDDVGSARFESLLNENMKDIMTHFREDFPDLSKAEYKFASYLFAGFSMKMICLLLNFQSIEAGYMRKSRFRKMIAESQSTNKDFYLNVMA